MTSRVIYGKVYRSERQKGGVIMATIKVREKPLFGNKRSHALNATKHAQKPNMQKRTVDGQKMITSARKAKGSKKVAA